jgi:hypothetical protein
LIRRATMSRLTALNNQVTRRLTIS